MIPESSETGWQDIGWNGQFFQLPATWQPTIIYPAYLFFEQEGRPAFEIKWEQIQGRFSADRILKQIKGTLKDGSRLAEWDIPPVLHRLPAAFIATGFQLQQGSTCRHGLVLFCPECKRATLLQWYIDTTIEIQTLTRIFESFRDHCTGPQQLWSLYDIKTHLPAEAKLRSHEFLPGRYTLCFDFRGTEITLYRFKPAGILLDKRSIGAFGQSLLNSPPLEEGNGWASWRYRAKGLDLLLAKARRNPSWKWVRLWHEPEQNVILGVKAEGKYVTETGWLDTICTNFNSLESR